MIELIDLKKQFGEKWVTKGINLVIPDNQMTVIIGRSGEGKSVLLKQIIGLIKPTSGSIIINEQEITNLPENELDNLYKQIGYVFQFAALLDSLTIFENVGIKLLENGMHKDEVLPIVQEKLALVQLNSDILLKYPSELSGGMRKRVGLARVLIGNPKIILYDEPTTGLDRITTKIIHQQMLETQKRLQATSLVVSHELDIFEYADNVALLHDGQIKYFGPAKTIWQADNPYVYQFIRGLADGPINTEIPYTPTTLV